MTRRLVLALAAAVLSTGIAGAQTPPSYKVVKAVPLGGPERWDYIVFDAASHRVYVSHGDRVSVVDGQDGSLIGEVDGIPGGTHGIGVSGGKVYTDDGKAGEAVVFDPTTLKILKHIPAKPDADGIAVDPSTGHVFVVDGDSKTVSVIDPKTDEAIATIDAGENLEYAVADGSGKIYVNGAGNGDIVRIDAKTNTVDARWPMTDCTRPHGLAIDPAGHRLFSSCVNKTLKVIDTTNGSTVASLPIGQGSDGAAFDPVRKRAFSSNGDGTLTVISQKDLNSYTVMETVATRVGGKTMGIDPKSGRLFIAAADIDPNAPAPPGPNGAPGRPKLLPGSLKLLFLDPVR